MSTQDSNTWHGGLFTPGAHDGIADEDYHADPALSHTGMVILANKTPLHFKHWLDSNEGHKDEFDFGKAAHKLILEGTTEGVEVLHFDNWRTKAAQERRDLAYAEGLIPILRKDWDSIVKMRDSIAYTPFARRILADGVAERSLFWRHETATRMRARLDKLVGEVVYDLKTCQSADPRKFGKTASDYGFHQQQAQYEDGYRTVYGDELHRFSFVNVEKVPPYACSIVTLHPDAVDLGRRLNEKAVRMFNECQATGIWPGYPTSEPVQLPTWAANQMEDSLA